MMVVNSISLDKPNHQARFDYNQEKFGYLEQSQIKPAKLNPINVKSNSVFDHSMIESSSRTSYFGQSLFNSNVLSENSATLRSQKNNDLNHKKGFLNQSVQKVQENSELPQISISTQNDQNQNRASINFGKFKQSSPRVQNNKEKSSVINSVSLGRSVQEWSKDLRETFFKGIGQANQTNNTSKQSLNLQFQGLNKRENLLLQSQLVSQNQLESGSISNQYEGNSQYIGLSENNTSKNLQLTTKSIQIQSNENWKNYSKSFHQSYSPDWNKKFRIFQSKQKQAIQNLIEERIEQSCLKSLQNQTELCNLSALKRCSLLQSTDKLNNRQQLYRQITNETEQINSTQSQANGINKNQMKSATNRSYRKRRTYKNEPEDEEISKKQELSLWRQLHSSIDSDIRKTEAPLNSNLVHFKKTFQKSQLNEESEDKEKLLFMAKYEGLGEIGQIYAQKEYEEFMQKKNWDEKILKATRTKGFEPWSLERVAARYTNSKRKQIEYLLHKDKQDRSLENKQVTEFKKTVGKYINDLNNSKIDFLDQSKNYDQNHSDLIISTDLYQKDKSSLQQTKNISNSPSPQQNQKLKRRVSNLSVKINSLDHQIQKQEKPFDTEKIAKNLIQKIEFQQLCKQSAAAPQTMMELLKNDPRQQYFQNCKSAVEPALDILNKVQDGFLRLEEYSLGEGMCNGFKKICETLPEMIKRVIVDNCKINQKSLTTFLQGLNSQKRIAQLCLKHTEIEKDSAQEISNMLEKYAPRNVDDLRLEKCSISIESTSIILKGLLIEFQVSKLALIELNLNQEHIQTICQLVKSSSSLVNLNLSYSRVSANNFLPLLQAICENTKLIYINLSWVKLLQNCNFCADAQADLLNAHNTSRLSQQRDSQLSNRDSENGSQLRKSQMSNFEDPQKSNLPKKQPRSQHEESVLSALTTLLTQNKKLIHLDLSETGLNSYVISRIMKFVRNSPSIVGLHLSGNPGVSGGMERRIMNSLRATYEQKVNLHSFQQIVDRESKGQDLRQKSPPNKSSNRINQALYLKQVNLMKRLETHSKALGDVGNSQTRQFILTRKVGHYLEMPGSSRWVLYKDSWDQCYICDRKIYSILFWSPTIGRIEGYDLGLTSDEQYRVANFILNNQDQNPVNQKLNQTLDPSLTKKWKRKIFDENKGDFIDKSEADQLSMDSISDILTSKSSEEQDESIPSYKKFFVSDGPAIEIKQSQALKKTAASVSNLPFIYGSFNNWQAQPMIPVHKLAMAFDQTTNLDILDLLKKKGLCREIVNECKQMNKREKEQFISLHAQHKQSFHRDEIWSKALMRILTYKEPHFASVSNIKYIDTKMLHFAAGFLSSGRQDYMVQHGSSFYFHQTIADFRREEVIFKKLSIEDKIKIERNPNVFKNWQIDSPEYLDYCARADFDYWKIPNFIKDPVEVDQIKFVIRENYTFLKDFHNICAAKSLSFPCVTQLYFGTIINECGLFDKNFTQGIVDTQFIASRVDVDKRNNKIHGQNMLDCNRFEFIECLIRIANIKFKQSGQALTISQAIVMLIETIKNNFHVPNSQEFRVKYLWNREVNLTFDANKHSINKLYEFCTKGKIRKMTFEEAMKLMTKDTKIKLSDQEAQLCYAQSLQTCSDLVKLSFIKSNHIDQLEFFELIGRVAYCIFSSYSDLHLHEKINKILDEWLALIGEKRKEPVYFIESGSEMSDNED